MNTRFVLSLAAVAVGVTAALAPLDSPAQQRRAEAARAESWVAPRTPWGDPDIQGLWPSGDWRRVPLQRPEELGTRSVLTPEEFAERERQAATDAAADAAEFAAPAAEVSNTPPSYWQDRGSAKLQASLIVDPQNGRLPARTPQVEQRIAARAAARQGRGPADSWEDRSLYERCISRGITSFLPTLYNNGNEILQSKGFVVIRHEMINETRIVPITDKPFSNIRTYMGEARGRWDGDTLVVESTNFITDKTAISGTPVSDALRLIERFTRVDPHTLRYEMTVDDPQTWVQPWTVSFDLTEDPGYPLIEYACHEGNYAMANILRAARVAEAGGDPTGASGPNR
jgi:hypothetical protein